MATHTLAVGVDPHRCGAALETAQHSRSDGSERRLGLVLRRKHPGPQLDRCACPSLASQLNPVSWKHNGHRVLCCAVVEDGREDGE